MATGATINTHVDAAISAMASSDWATAASELMQAAAALVGVPDTEFDSRGIKWSREGISDLLKQVRQEQNASATTRIQQTKVTYARPT